MVSRIDKLEIHIECLPACATCSVSDNYLQCIPANHFLYPLTTVTKNISYMCDFMKVLSDFHMVSFTVLFNSHLNC